MAISLRIFALQPLGGKLDRRQRILDLMRDAARDIGPGGGALGAETRSVMSSKVTTKPCGEPRSLETCTLSVRVRAGALDRDFAAGPAHGLGHGAADQRRQFRHGFGIMPAFQFFRRGIEQARGGAVDDGDLAVAVQADHAGADARQHGFGEAAALVDLPVGGDQIAALGVELLGHAVEGKAQRADLVVVALDFDLRLEIAFRNALGRADQAGDRPHQPVGGPQARARSPPAG